MLVATQGAQIGLPAGGEGGGAALAAFLGYLIVILGIGVFATRFSSAGMREFFLAGRGLNRYVVALSAVVSGRSAWLLLGLTGMAYARGPSAAWAAVGYIVVELFLFLFYARRLRRFTEAYDCVTLPDFFAARFGDANGALRGTLAVVILVFMVSYVSAQFVGGGKAFSASFGIDPALGVGLTAAIVLAYTALGGFLAVSLTDMLQAIFMIVALVLLPVVAIADLGGLGVVIERLGRLDSTMIDPFAISAGAAIGLIGIGLGSPGNPHILVRYMAIKSARDLRAAALVGTVWNVVMAWGALFIGLVGRAAFPDVAQLPAGDTENLYPTLAQVHLHPVLFGIVVASIFAAIMSTADSQLLVASSAVVRDLYERIVRKGRTLDQQRLVLYSRVVTVLLVALALLLGFILEGLVFWLVLFAWAGLGAALGPTSILALYWRGTTRTGVLAGLVTGTVVTVLWKRTPDLSAVVYELVPAFVLAGAATVIISRITRRPEDIDRMFRIMKGEP